MNHHIFHYRMDQWQSSELGFLNKLDDIIYEGGIIVSIMYLQPTNTSSFDGYKVIWKK